MKEINSYIIEKLRINKNAKLTHYSTELSDIMDVSEEFFSILHKKMKHETNVLNIEKQSLYTRKDWGDDNFIRIEFPQYMTKDLFHTLFNDLSKYLTDRIENLYIRENSFLPEKGKKYGIKYVDILIKKNQNITEKLRINKDTEIESEKSIEWKEHNLTDSQCINRLKKALTTIYSNNISVSYDYQGDPIKNRYYEINIETINNSKSSAFRLLNYCKKIDKIEIIDKNGLLNSSYTFIGNKNIWIRIAWGNRSIKGIRISKAFYDSKAFPKDQSYVSKRSWQM